MNLAGKNIVVYDLETKRLAEECTNGWKSFEEMGVSCACAYDYRDGRFRVFMQDNLESLTARLNEPDTLIVGFNHVRFDNEVLRSNGQDLKEDSLLNNYDILLASREGAKVEKFAKGFKLDEHLRALGLPQKSGSGALAPQLFREKKRGELIDYCLNDVFATKNLFEWIMQTGVCGCGHDSGYFYKVNRPNI